MKLTDRQVAMLKASGEDTDGVGFGVDLRGSADWQTTRALRDLDLGWIEGGKPQGSQLPGLFFANADGIWLVKEDEPEEDDD